MAKKMLLISMVIFLIPAFLSGCFKIGYKGENPELYTVAIYNFFGAHGYGSNGEIHIPAELGVIEEDSYGRVLFYYDEGIVDEGCGYGILPKSADGYAYYYEDDCILCAKNDWQGNGEVTYEEWFTAEELSAFKARNDWDQLIREEKCTKKAVLSRKPGEKLNLEKKDFEKATKDWLTNNGFPIKSDKRIYTTKEFFMADDYGREIYCIYVNETCLDATIDERIVLAVMFMPDGTCDPTVSVICIDDMKNYRDQMKAFRQSNGWDTEYKAE